MANQKITQLNSLDKSTIASNDVIPVVDVSSSETKKITYQELTQPTDANFAIADNLDTTKKVAFQVSGVTASTTRTLTVPDANTTIVGTDTTQTLSNKTLTAPQINMNSDATGDMYYRNGSGVTSRLPIGSAGQIIQASVSGVPEWIANPGASDASDTIKGVVELATQAEIENGTSTGGTGARLVIPNNLNGSRFNLGHATVGGTANAITLTFSPAPTQYLTGMRGTFTATNTNTGATTINVNGLGAVSVKKNVTGDLNPKDIITGDVCEVVYDGTNFQLVSNNFLKHNLGITTGTAIGSSSTTTVITHGLNRIPSRIQLKTLTLNTFYAIRAISFGTCITDTTSILGQNSVTLIESGNSINNTNTTSNSVIGYTNYGNNTSTGETFTITAVTATTFTITATGSGINAGLTPYFTWEVEA